MKNPTVQTNVTMYNVILLSTIEQKYKSTFPRQMTETKGKNSK